MNKIIKEFFVPFVRLRSNKNGYGVSLIKAGAKIIERDAVDVRAPLTMPTTEETKKLHELIDLASELV